MSTYAVGDIHGNIQALESLLDRVTGLLVPDDTLVFLGDFIDRGPDSRQCIDRIIELRGTAPCRVVTLLGNHEDWLRKTMHEYSSHSWLIATEALETIRSYSPEAAARIRSELELAGMRIFAEKAPIPYEVFFDAMPDSHKDFLLNLQPACRTRDGVFVHGGVSSEAGPIEEQPASLLIWGPSGFPESYRGEDTVVYGHLDNSVIDGNGWPMPRILDNNTVGIDTISFGVLTAIRLPDRVVFQSDRFPIRPR